MRGRTIRTTRLSGTPEAMGRHHGEEHAEEIRAYTADRVTLAGRGPGWSAERVLELAEDMLPAHEAYDADLFAEMLAMAEAAGISAAEAVVVGGYTDFLDAVHAASLVPGSGPAGSGDGREHEDDCTAVLVPAGIAEHGAVLAQTWDMHASATPRVLLLDIRPESGPPALVFSTVGTLGQIGLNAAGLAVGINNLTADDGRPGVTWPFVVRRALREHDLDAAVSCILEAELAGGHNFLVLGSDGRGVSIEAMPTARHVEELGAVPLTHTNHCLAPATRAVEGERPASLQASSELRLRQVPEVLAARPVTIEDLVGLLRDERAICRRPEPPFDYESCGAAIMRPASGELWACWGVPSENDFEHFRVGM